MPTGRYLLHDPHDGTPLGAEHFQCAPGPSGWRYVSQFLTPEGDHRGSVDVTLDALGRPLRVELHAGGWQVRAAALDGVTWVRTDPTGEHATEGNVRAHAVTGASPAFLVATARLLRPSSSEDPVRVRLVAFTDPVLAPLTVDRTWALTGRETHPTDSGPLVVDTYRVTDLGTGEQHTVHLAGDVVLAAPGIELDDLQSPPSAFTDPGPPPA
ncbi:hypothetical protein [Streptomyces sp. NPDC002644]